MGGRMSSKMTGTGRRRKKNGKILGKYKVLGTNTTLTTLVPLSKKRRKNRIDIKETGLK